MANKRHGFFVVFYKKMDIFFGLKTGINSATIDNMEPERTILNRYAYEKLLKIIRSK